MAELKLALGAVADVASGAELDDLKSELLGGMDKLRPRPEIRPIYRTLVRTGVMPAAGNLLIRVGDDDSATPPAGRLWNVLQTVIIGNDDHTTVASASAAWYIGSVGINPGDIPALGGLFLPGQAVPQQNTYSSRVVWVQSGEQLMTIIYGAAAGTNIAALTRIAEYPVPSVEAMRV